MSPDRPLGFAIVGLGMIADFHARAIAQVDGARLVGVMSRSREKAHAFAEKYAVPFVTDDFDALLARPEVEIVCITTPAGTHREFVLPAIEAGKHLIIEKPIEITTARADDILRAAEAKGVKVGAIFQARFGDGARTVKTALDAGRFGRIVLASAYVKWHRPASYYSGYRGSLALDGGGVLLNQAIHAVDLLLWFAGMPAEVFCHATRRVHADIEAEDTVSATMRFASGALGGIEATTAGWPGWQRRLEICGELGSVCLEDDRITKWDFRDSVPADADIRAGAEVMAPAVGASAPAAISLEGHRRQIENVVEAIRHERPLAVDGGEARKAVATIEALYRSARLGKPVAL